MMVLFWDGVRQAFSKQKKTQEGLGAFGTWTGRNRNKASWRHGFNDFIFFSRYGACWVGFGIILIPPFRSYTSFSIRSGSCEVLAAFIIYTSYSCIVDRQDT